MAKNEPVDPTAAPGTEAGKKPAGRPTKKKTFKKRGEKRIIHYGYAHIQASFNNTIVTITDPEGNVVAWSSAGGIGFKGSRKGTPFAATQAAIAAGNAAKAFGMRTLEVRHPGYGFADHKGYPVPAHYEALGRLGACAAHRRSFGPVRKALGLPPLPPWPSASERAAS